MTRMVVVTRTARVSVPKQTTVLVDTREEKWTQHVIQSCMDPGVTVEIVTLPEGDFLVPDQDSCIIVIERKTVTDFLSSLRDGRLASQFTRLQAYPMCGLIVEGSYQVSGNGRIVTEGFDVQWSHASLQMSIWSLQRNLPGLIVWWTNGLGESADVIRAIANRGRNGCFRDSTLFAGHHDSAGGLHTGRHVRSSRNGVGGEVKAPGDGRSGRVAGRRSPAPRSGHTGGPGTTGV